MNLKTLTTIGMVGALVMGIFVGYSVSLEKVNFLENELGTERLHNEWESQSLDFMAYAVDSYSFRGKTFEDGSECAQYFIDYQMSRPYDIFVKAPALMKFDKSCNPQAP